MFLAVLGIAAPDGVQPQDVGARVASSYEQALLEHRSNGEVVDFRFATDAIEGADEGPVLVTWIEENTLALATIDAQSSTPRLVRLDA